MARDTRTAQQNHDWWMDRAAEYDREADTSKTPQGRTKWRGRAVAARLSAAKSLSPPAP